MIRPNVYKLGKCGACNAGTVTYSDRHKLPRCELCGQTYPELERAHAQPSRLTGVLCGDCEKFTDEPTGGLCRSCHAKAERLAKRYMKREDGRPAGITSVSTLAAGGGR